MDQFGTCLILDLHSFPSTPLPFEFSQTFPRPDICVGTDDFHTSKALIEFTKNFFENQGLSVKLDDPFSGSIVPRRYYRKTPEVQSIMIEINRALYMDETSGKKAAGFDLTRAIIGRYIRSACEFFLHPAQEHSPTPFHQW